MHKSCTVCLNDWLKSYKNCLSEIWRKPDIYGKHKKCSEFGYTRTSQLKGNYSWSNEVSQILVVIKTLDHVVWGFVQSCGTYT